MWSSVCAPVCAVCGRFSRERQRSLTSGGLWCVEGEQLPLGAGAEGAQRLSWDHPPRRSESLAATAVPLMLIKDTSVTKMKNEGRFWLDLKDG